MAEPPAYGNISDDETVAGPPVAAARPTAAEDPALSDTVDSAPRTGQRQDPQQLRRGMKLGRYVIEEVLGAGGMGVVYRALDPELDRRVALKLLLSRGLADDSARTRLLREAQAMARLSHPNIVAVHEVGEIDGLVYVAMEFVVGRTLRRWFDEGPHSRAELLRVMLDAGEGLAAAHAKGLVHRDFKPDNVMVDETGRVRVMDFGLARASDSNPDTFSDDEASLEGDVTDHGTGPLAASLTQTGSMLGTPRYMAPEQFQGRIADARTDQFAFSLVLWEALYGMSCFKAGSIASLAVAVTQGRREPRPKTASVPRWLHDVLDRGLQTDPAQRFASMEALMDALRSDPTRRRRIVAGLTVVAVAGLAVAGGYQLDEHRARTHCHEAAAEISEDWNPSVRSQMHDAMVGTTVASAETSFERAAERLDTYAAQWSRAREEACLAQHFEDGDAQQLDASEECLRRRRHGLSSLVDSLVESPSASDIELSTSGASQLDPIEQCSDPRWLAQFPPLPKDPDRRAAIERAQDFLTDADTAQAMGSYAEAIERADQAVEQARGADWITTEARAHRTAGVALVKLGKHTEGADRLREAASLATAGGLTRVAIDAQLTLMSALVDYLQGYDEAARLSEILERTIPSAEPEPGELALEWHFITAKMFEIQGPLELASQHYAEALELALKIHGADHPNLAGIYMGEGSVALSRGDLERSAERFGKAVEVTRNIHGADSPLVSAPLGNLAIVERELGRFDDSRQHLQRAIEIDTAAFGADHLNVAYGLDALGVLLQAEGKPAQAAESHRRAVEILVRDLGTDHLDTSYAMANLAAAQMEAGEIDEACEAYPRVLTIREQALGPDNPALVSAVEGLARCALERGQSDEAIAHYERAMKLIVDARGEDDPRVAPLREALELAKNAERD